MQGGLKHIPGYSGANSENQEALRKMVERELYSKGNRGHCDRVAARCGVTENYVRGVRERLKRIKAKELVRKHPRYEHTEEGQLWAIIGPLYTAKMAICDICARTGLDRFTVTKAIVDAKEIDNKRNKATQEGF